MNEFKLISEIALEISDRYKRILEIFPKDEDKQIILKHLAAASIHTVFFIQDMYNLIDNKKTDQENRNQFLNECGCKDNK